MFDDIGNRQTTKVGGDSSGSNLRLANYTNNALNQITGREVPGYIEVQGVATNTATVTVNGATAYRKDTYYRAELSVDNTSGAIYQSITNEGALSPDTADITGNVYLPQAPETNAYDLDGNLLSDGRFNYTWNGENRLTAIESLTNAPYPSRRREEISYDDTGRCLWKRVLVWNTSTNGYQLATKKQYWYDNWNLVSESDGASTNVQTYCWGLDLSGSIHGAGGVDGLLWMDAGTNGVHFFTFDGDGNVGALVNAADGTTSGTYVYGPFGELIRATGPMAFVNPFRFSTKYQDDETGLLYYGYRYYNPSTGRWPNKDPMQEQGGMNLYGFVGNDSIDNNDTLGLSFWNPDWLKNLQRAFWNKVAEKYMRPHGLNMSADLLEHSLLDNCG